MAAVVARACERSGAEWSGQRSVHISFRAEIACVCITVAELQCHILVWHVCYIIFSLFRVYADIS